ncbi:uncharacterized protein A1O9_07544 [Exophiala aquamarina CBS 119918]|uniref:Uncharacterized protein n=1 Tax=Exophiala aquamarina CBS 119918 TaxID=1182545 RepID=A0A072P771_9EURO|nr:uncharacterized protein A1O9_07544 [Exophiala aquamarina CBS 119918]KEF55964.1 hypothetical protein A1O9_07544 [Exophiala aquamarina CBS 119918]
MTGARLRQSFKYPSDGEGSNDSHDEMDEEEQETLITNLRSSETATNVQYTVFFTALPIITILVFIYFLFLSTKKSVTLACLLSITSLLATAYIMYMIPTGAALFTNPVRPRLDLSAVALRRRGRQIDLPDFFGGADSPLTQYLPYLNTFLSVLLALLALGFRGKSGVPDGIWAFFLLPGMVFAIVLVVRASINDIQKGLTELQGMRYDYKGA